MGLAELPPEDVADLTLGVRRGDSDPTGGDPPCHESSGDPVLTAAEAGRHRDVGMVPDRECDVSLDGPRAFVEDVPDEPYRVVGVEVIALRLLAFPEPLPQFRYALLARNPRQRQGRR